MRFQTGICKAINISLEVSKLKYFTIGTRVLAKKYWTLAKLNISIVSCKIVRTYMMFAHNNSYNDFAIANRFMNFVNLSGFAPCQGKNEIVLLTQIWPIGMWDPAWDICDRYPTDTGYRSLLRYVSCSCNEPPTP